MIDKKLIYYNLDNKNNPIYAIGIRPKNSPAAIVLNKKLSQLGELSKDKKHYLLKKIGTLLPIAKSYV